jgi:hypothetical protein
MLLSKPLHGANSAYGVSYCFVSMSNGKYRAPCALSCNTPMTRICCRRKSNYIRALYTYLPALYASRHIPQVQDVDNSSGRVESSIRARSIRALAPVISLFGLLWRQRLLASLLILPVSACSWVALSRVSSRLV